MHEGRSTPRVSSSHGAVRSGWVGCAGRRGAGRRRLRPTDGQARPLAVRGAWWRRRRARWRRRTQCQAPVEERAVRLRRAQEGPKAERRRLGGGHVGVQGQQGRRRRRRARRAWRRARRAWRRARRRQQPARQGEAEADEVRTRVTHARRARMGPRGTHKCVRRQRSRRADVLATSPDGIASPSHQAL